MKKRPQDNQRQNKIKSKKRRNRKQEENNNLSRSKLPKIKKLSKLQLKKKAKNQMQP